MAVVQVGEVTVGYELHGPAGGEPVLLLGGTSMPRGVWAMMQLPALMEAGQLGDRVCPTGSRRLARRFGDHAWQRLDHQEVIVTRSSRCRPLR
jgi:hypothetical protein